MKIAALHAGAGYHSKSNAPEYKTLLTKALKAALSSNNCIDGICNSLKILENHNLTNAGISGANICLDGTIECDAAIMNTEGMGSIVAVPMLVDDCSSNPIMIAKKLLQIGIEGVDEVNRQPPITLAGIKAQEFARKAGLDLISKIQSESLILPSQLERYHRHLTILKTCQDETVDQDLLQDTVGGIMIGSNDVCAAVSSGGISLKRPGRVGEAGLPGTGIWAAEKDNFKIGISISGTGEQIMKSMLAIKVADKILSSPDSILAALTDCIEEFLNNPMISKDPIKNAGVLVLASNGARSECVWAHTTESFCIAYQSENQLKPAFIISRKNPGKDYCVAGRAIV